MNEMYVDLEVISSDNGMAFENEIYRIEPKASLFYQNKLELMFENVEIDEFEYRKQYEESEDLRNKVLEEVDPSIGVVDFYKIYAINSSNKEMVGFINKISVINSVKVIFYYNTEREKKIKEDICKKVFPFCESIPIPYFQEKYSPNKRRKRTSKTKFIMEKFSLSNVANRILIDKSESSCEEWSQNEGHTLCYSIKDGGFSTINTDSDEYSNTRKVMG